MPEVIRSVSGKFDAEKTIEKSRFLSYCAHVTSEEEARSFIAEIKGMHPAATHHCYGFIADKTGALQRFSDDGEPQGTAGMPILDVINNKGLYETAVVVVRYFGGIKLGAGGLVRAYSSSAADVLSIAKICVWQVCAQLTVSVGYARVDAALKFFSLKACEVLSSDYGNEVIYTVLVKKAEEKGFTSALIDYLQGKVRVEKEKEYYAPFEEK